MFVLGAGTVIAPRWHGDRKIHPSPNRAVKHMLWAIFVAVLVLWAAGVVSAHMFGGLIHVLLGIGVAIVVLRFVQDRPQHDNASETEPLADSPDREADRGGGPSRPPSTF